MQLKDICSICLVELNDDNCVCDQCKSKFHKICFINNMKNNICVVCYNIKQYDIWFNELKRK